MPQRQSVRYPARSEAMRGNKNRAIAEGEEKRGATRNLSMDHRTWEEFKAAADLYAGKSLSDKEYKDLWRDLCSGAVIAFIKANHGLTDPEILIV